MAVDWLFYFVATELWKNILIMIWILQIQSDFEQLYPGKAKKFVDNWQAIKTKLIHLICEDRRIIKSLNADLLSGFTQIGQLSEGKPWILF